MQRNTCRMIWVVFVAGLILTPRVRAGDEPDCNNNGVPDATELSGNDCNANGLLDVCENDTWAVAAELSGIAATGFAGYVHGNVDIDGDIVVVGDPGYYSPADQISGRIRIYAYAPDSGWTLEQQIAGPWPPIGIQAFGDQVAVRGDRIVVTMPGRRVDGVQRGAIFVYRRVGHQWELEDTIESPRTSVFFGQRIELAGNRLFVQLENLSSSGTSSVTPRLLIYINRGAGWELEQSIFDGSTENRSFMGPSQRSFYVQEDLLITAERRTTVFYDNGDFGGIDIVDHLVFHQWSAGRWTPVSRTVTWYVGADPGNFGFGDVGILGDDMILGSPQFGSSLILKRNANGWQTVDQVFNLAGNWIEPMGDVFWTNRQASQTGQVREVRIEASGPIVTSRPELDGLVGMGRRSGNRWAFQQGAFSTPECLISLWTRDCDSDGVLDECAIAAGASDVDGNGVPDSCEPDCNGDGIPDASQLELGDCNANGVLDVCDIDPADPDGDGETSPDCNGNLVPDACERDCDGNGIPDACDLDGADPDGDGLVAEDCDGNGVPDACDRRSSLVRGGVLTPSGDFAGLSFGAALAADGDVVVVGAPATDSQSGVIGRVFVYRRTDSMWNEETVIMPELSDANGSFGEKVVIQGDTLLVGSRRTTSTTVSAYRFDSGSWIFGQVIELPVSAADRYGFSIDDDQLAVASDTNDTIRTYERQFDDWVQTDSVHVLPGAGTFNGDILIRGDHLFVRYPGNRVIVYLHDVFGWYYLAEVDAAFPFNGGDYSSSLDEELIAVGNPLGRCEGAFGFFCGRVEISRFLNGSCFLDTIIQGPRDAEVSELTHFGAAVATFGERLVVGAPLAGAGAGRFYYYERDGGNWILRQEVESPLAPSALNFGSKFAIGGDTLFVAATRSYPALQDTDADAVFIYSTIRDVDDDGVFDACQPDCDGNQLPDAWELATASVDAFTAALLSNAPSCAFDANGDGAVNGLDIGEYVNLLLVSP